MQPKPQIFSAIVAFSVLSPPSIGGAFELSDVYFSPHFGVSQFSSELSGTTHSYDEDSAGQYRISLGYTLSDRWDAELYYNALGEASLSPNGNISYSAFGLDSLYYFYQGLERKGVKSLLLYGRLGAAYLDRDSEVDLGLDSQFAPSYGLGGEFQLKEGFGARLELNAFDSDVVNVSLGFVKRFGDMAAGPSPQTQASPPPFETSETFDAPEIPAPFVDEPIPTLSAELPDLAAVAPTPDPTPAHEDFFTPGSDQLTARAQDYLADWVQRAQGNENTIEVHVYSADGDVPRENLLLSLDRCYAVIRHLSERGVGRHRLSPVGHGQRNENGDQLTLRWSD